MDLFSKKIVKDLFKKYQIKPFKGWGQNFLIDEKVAKKIIETANLCSKDIVLEIGPGLGTLTAELAKKAGRVIAVEKDQKMIEISKETLKDFDNIEVVQGDILKTQNSPGRLLSQTAGQAKLKTPQPRSAKRDRQNHNLKLKTKNYKVVANLPYYIVSPVIRKFLELKNPPKEMVLMAQKEVAQRICPKSGKMNLLAVSIQFYSTPEIVHYVSKKSFWPTPKVDSAIIKLKVTRPLRLAPVHHSRALAGGKQGGRESQKLKVDRNLFFKIVKTGFSQPRKQLLNNFSKKFSLDKKMIKRLELDGSQQFFPKNKERIKNWLLKNNIDYRQRAETLSIQDWINLTKSV